MADLVPIILRLLQLVVEVWVYWRAEKAGPLTAHCAAHDEKGYRDQRRREQDLKFRRRSEEQHCQGMYNQRAAYRAACC